MVSAVFREEVRADDGIRSVRERRNLRKIRHQQRRAGHRHWPKLHVREIALTHLYIAVVIEEPPRTQMRTHPRRHLLIHHAPHRSRVEYEFQPVQPADAPHELHQRSFHHDAVHLFGFGRLRMRDNRPRHCEPHQNRTQKTVAEHFLQKHKPSPRRAQPQRLRESPRSLQRPPCRRKRGAMRCPASGSRRCSGRPAQGELLGPLMRLLPPARNSEPVN